VRGFNPAHDRSGSRMRRKAAALRDFDTAYDGFGSKPISHEVKRGRDGRYRPPPAQNRAGGIPAHGSHLGCVTAKR
jgi:hypothetical protein